MKKTKKQEKSRESIRELIEEKASYDIAAGGAIEGSASSAAKRRGLRAWMNEFAAVIGANEARDPAVLGIKLIRGLFFAAISFLLGRTSLLLDTYPLGISLLCAAENNVFYIFAGAAISAFTVEGAEGVLFSPYVYLAAYAMIVLIRFAARTFIDTPEGFSLKALFGAQKNSDQRRKMLRILFAGGFEENTYLKMATACVAAFLVSLYAMSSGEYRFYDLFSAMFAMIGAPAITFIFSWLWGIEETGSGHLPRDIASVALLCAVVFALRETYIFGISAAVFLAFGAVLYMARRRGVLFASVIGLCTGLATAPIYAPAFVLGAIAAGIIHSSSFTSCAVAIGVAMLWGAYIDGFGAFTMLMPALLSSSVIVMAAESLSFLPKSAFEVAEKTKEKTDINEAESTEERIKRLSETFGELSRGLYDISDRLQRPGMAEIRDLCLDSFETGCSACEKNEICRHQGYGEFSEMVTKVGEVLCRDGRVRQDKLPDYIPEKCGRISDILEEVNTSFAELLERRITGEKTELFALDYDAVSHIISDAIDFAKRENDVDEELTARLRRFGKRADIGMKEISVRGMRKKRIYSGNIGRKAEEMGVRELRQELENACGFPLRDLVFELRDGKVALRTEAARRFSVEKGRAVFAGKDESVCGDTAAFFENENDNFYAFISDGMGSGQSAAFTSEICGLFLTKMLMGGNKKETSLKMLNTLLRSKGEECSATVDLMEIDLISGKASFIKSGAAPSFVRRGDKLYKLRSNTAPIGIMRTIDAEQVRFDLEDGDVIIMLSDGISQAPEECFWLMELLGGEWEDDGLDKIAERICRRAAEEGSADDSSAMLIRVNEIWQKEKTA